MSTTLTNAQTYCNSRIGDSSTDRISAVERLAALTEATVWVQQELGNDLQNFTSTQQYYDTVNYYKVTTDIADLLEGADLRRKKDIHNISFTHKSAREVAEEIGQGNSESSWAIERRDDDTYLVINHQSKNSAKQVASFDSTTADSGTWAVDDTNSDATNLTTDTIEFEQGAGSLNFDLDVSQSGNNRATIINSTYGQSDWSNYEDLAAHIIRVYIPDVTETTSVTLFWGSDSSNYWSVTATTDIDGSAFTNGWNRIKVDWADATATSSPDVENIDWLRVDINYGAGQGDDTDYRLDDWIMVNPEELTFHYVSWKVGEDTNGTDIYKFSVTSDVPYYSGQYDQLDFVVGRKAASILFDDLRLFNESLKAEKEAKERLKSISKYIPSSRTNETKSFKVYGLNLRK